MMLLLLILIPLLAGLAAWLLARWSDSLSRAVCLVALSLDLAILVAFWAAPSASPAHTASPWLAELNCSWIPSLGIRFHLALDGLSLLMLLLTAFMGLAAVVCSWREVSDRVGLFHLNLMWVLVGIIGVFLAVDLFLFYFFWEMMLVPMFLLIRLWGHENRIYASLKFFLFTQAGGLLLLLGIVGLAVLNQSRTGLLTFDYVQLLGASAGSPFAFWLMLAFVAAFAVKLPVVPLHTWLADAHTEAPTAGSVVLAALLLKTAAYGLLRFALPLFPEASASFAPVGMILGVVGILYGASLAFAQKDLKRLVAFTSISHMGFVMLGIYAGTTLALQGAVVQMICHGVSTGALFILVGLLHERIRTRDLDLMGGLWSTNPRLGAFWLFFALASMGLPGLGNFVGEFLVMLGTWPVSPVLAVLAATGMIASVIYALWMFQSAFHGPSRLAFAPEHLAPRELVLQSVLVVVIVAIGLFPRPILKTFEPVMTRIHARLQSVSPAPPVLDVSAPSIRNEGGQP